MGSPSLMDRYDDDHPPKHLQLLDGNKNSQVIKRNAGWEDKLQQINRKQGCQLWITKNRHLLKLRYAKVI